MNARDRQPDACPYSATPGSFAECPAFEPDDFPVSDSHDRSLTVITTCRHLSVGSPDAAGAGGFYARCGLGSAEDREAFSRTR